jgi:hypothetical protein
MAPSSSNYQIVKFLKHELHDEMAVPLPNYSIAELSNFPSHGDDGCFIIKLSNYRIVKLFQRWLFHYQIICKLPQSSAI